MADPLTLTTIIPIITGGISAAVQIAIAIVKFWQAQKDRRIQAQAYESTASTSVAAKDLQSVMGVHSSFWKKNPAMFQALGSDAARILKDAYSRSNGYLNQLAQYAGQIPERMDWKSASVGIGSVNQQLRELFADHLGKVISKMACGNMLRRVLLPKDVKEKIARENTNLLKQAQNDLGLLIGQMKAGEEGTKKQIEWYEQQAQQVQAHPSGYYPGQQTFQQVPQPIQNVPQPIQPGFYAPQQHPQVQQQVYQQPVQQYYQQQQVYPQHVQPPAPPQQQVYVPVYQIDSQAHSMNNGNQAKEDDKSECIIS